jgi:3-(3-hydroxy-phenyl)propionate hydroxylase
MTNHSVIIAGAGPTGMMLGAELKLAGVDVAIIERRPTPELSGARAGSRGLQARTLEVFDMRGIAGRFLAEGRTAQVAGFNMVRLDLSDFPTRHPYGLALVQKHTERILAGWIDELGVKIYRSRELTGFAQDGDGVTVQLSDGTSLRADYLVGCDGGRSLVRKFAGIEFPGWDASISWLIAEAAMTETPPFGFKETPIGTHALGQMEDRVGIVLAEPAVRATSERTLDDLRRALVEAYGTDFGVHSPNFISSFTDAARQAATYRKGRVLLAGDAAHIHAPLGGMGLNVGVQDAVNLGWKLAQVVKGISPDSLLDSYEAERHPVAARVLKNTLAHVAVRRVDDRSKALSDYVTDWLKTEEVRKRMAGEMSGLDTCYDLDGNHPLVGRRMPDLALITDDGPIQVFSLLHDPRPLMINFGDARYHDDRVRCVDARYEGSWELPVIGTVPAPTAVLIRPDGHVAWVDDGQSPLNEAVTRWFGKSRGTS